MWKRNEIFVEMRSKSQMIDVRVFAAQQDKDVTSEWRCKDAKEKR